MPPHLPAYQPDHSYEWNYEHAPDPDAVEFSALPEPARVPGKWDFCGLPVGSPLGVPAGPLLNGRWVLYYAHLGFDVLTYKTVRTRFRACYPSPNLIPVRASVLSGGDSTLPTSARMEGSWAISFGMPSQAPEVWRRDVEWTRSRLPKEKLLSVSVVGSMQPDWSLEDLAVDYARCARWAVESGADCVEANLSCPNVSSQDGRLYLQPDAARQVAAAVRDAIGRRPLILKIGHIRLREDAASLLEAVSPYTDALAMTNCITARVTAPDGTPLFQGEGRGIGGAAIRDASLRQVALFAELQRNTSKPVRLVGVGGISTGEDVRHYLRAGAHAVHIATAAMLDSSIALRLRADLAESASTGQAE